MLLKTYTLLDCVKKTNGCLITALRVWAGHLLDTLTDFHRIHFRNTEATVTLKIYKLIIKHWQQAGMKACRL